MGRDDEQEDGAAADDETSPADLAASDITNNDAITRRPAHSAHSTHTCTGPIYTISYDLSYDYLKVIVKSTYNGSRVVSVLDLGAEGPGFISQSRRCRVTVCSHPSCLYSPSSETDIAALLKVARVTAGLAESNDNLPAGL